MKNIKSWSAGDFKNLVWLTIAVILTIYIFVYLTKRYPSSQEPFPWQKSYEPIGADNFRPFSGEIIENAEQKVIVGDKRPFIIPDESVPVNNIGRMPYFPNRIRPPPMTETLKELNGAPPITKYRVLAELDYFNNPQPF